MTAKEQLYQLWRLFGEAGELAVSPELFWQYEQEITLQGAINSSLYFPVLVYAPETLPHGVTVSKTALFFRDKPLTIVYPKRA